MTAERMVFVVAGLGFGDEGKGTIVEYLARREHAHAVVRYNGGPQAAHHVVLPDGRWHCFSQFGAGSFIPGMRSHLSRSMLVKPSNLLVERDALASKGAAHVARSLTIDPGAYLVTPWSAMLGRMEEVARGAAPHGSVGMGVGNAALDRRRNNPNALQMADLLRPERLREKLEALWEEKSTAARALISRHPHVPDLARMFEQYRSDTAPDKMLAAYRENGALLEPCLRSDEKFGAGLPDDSSPLVLEGAQGVLLDVTRGFVPHVTKTDTTFRSADEFLRRAGLEKAPRVNVGILRAYGTRHGAGPFVTEAPALTPTFPERHNGDHRWQGSFRVGYFDLPASRYALAVSGGADLLALTHLDTVGKEPRFSICDGYAYLGSAGFAELETFFEFETVGTERIVRAIRAPKDLPPGHQSRLTELLASCRPHSFIEFDGWGAARPADGKPLPAQLERFLEFLESPRGLGCPIRILSAGPTVEDKVYRAP